jgi:hypothetical protein
MDIPRLSQSSEFLSLVPISDADVCKAIKRLKHSKYVALDDNHGFIIKVVHVFLFLFLGIYLT